MAEPTYIEATASFDDARIYRYTLLRRWAAGPLALWIMLNPSTADELKLDPTLHRCLDFTRAWTTGDPWVRGDDFDVLARSRHDEPPQPFGAFEVCNLYAFRASKPSVMRRAADPIGANNDAAIAAAAERARLVIVAWGNKADPHRARAVAQLLADIGVHPYALQLTSSGAPSHPLARGKSWVPIDVTPARWHAKGLR